MPALTALLLASCIALPGSPPAKAHLAQTLAVGGEGGWDYLVADGDSGRLYVPRGTHVQVLDLQGRGVGDIPGTAGVHGVALAKELDRGFTSNGRANTMTVFRLSTLEVLKEVKTTGENPDAILYEPATKQVFTFNGRGKNATVFSAATLEVTGTLPMGGKPEFSVADGKGGVFVNVEDTAELLSIDARALKVSARWSLKPLADPTGLAFDPVRQHLFAVGGNKLMAVVDAGSGRILATLPIGQGCDGAGFDPGTGTAFASNGEGTLTVVRQGADGTYAVAQGLPTARGARTMAVDESHHRVYLPTAEFGPAPEAKAGQRARPPMLPGSFKLLVVAEGN